MGNIELIKLNLNKNFQIEIPIEIYASLLEYRQMASEPEAGGIFVGKRLLNKTILVVDISKPESDDLRGRFTFSKTSPTHQQFADDYFDKSSGFISLIGEWHTHPEDIPTASKVDIQSWDKIISDNDDRLFFLIIGLQAGRFYYRKSNKWQSKLIYFKDV
ncbi:Mov34/MPN/PAD-1 family protein [Streptococcus parasuis]|jgi:integrative and conjugative element protein (TIGR02256 family)|uniref:Mov34/MPN/PAD-1 family protein n=1 Tax=Streptococcus parasuis TaxID=1501662 RepID=UPI0028AF4553|nr:Mov34/MPN/PAD-1 family protein [Streptococcus parasuis]